MLLLLVYNYGMIPQTYFLFSLVTYIWSAPKLVLSSPPTMFTPLMISFNPKILNIVYMLAT